MQNQRKDKVQIMSYFSVKTAMQSTAVCNITGIRITIQAPVIKNNKNMVLEYQNPLAIYNNAKDFAKQGFMQSHNFTDTTILAGCMLTLLHYGRIRQDKLSSVEANIYLSQLSKIELSKALHFIVNLSHFELQRIPKLSLNESDPKALINWMHSAQEKLIAKPDIEEIAKKVSVASSSSKATVPVELRKQARTLLSFLKENKLVNSSFASILTLSIQGNNIATIHNELREKLILGLEKIEIEQAKELANLFYTAGKKMKQYQENLDKEIEDLSVSKTVNVQTPANKLSVMEMLQRQIKGERFTVTKQSITAEDDIEAEYLAKQNSSKPNSKQNNQNKQNNNNQNKQSEKQQQIIALMQELNSELNQEQIEALQEQQQIDSEFSIQSVDEFLSEDEFAEENSDDQL